MWGEASALDIRGVEVSYYLICHTKLWLFSHNTHLEHTSDAVAIGKYLHEKSYQRKTKELSLGSINIDFYRRGDETVLHEVKKSRKMEESHKYQLLYYLYYLRRFGVNARGVINYPLLRKTLDVELTEERIEKLESILREIPRIVSLDTPPKPVKKRYCRRCSYFEFCWVR
jgi:CRISPR-associated exonuclease Cas4